MMTLLGQHGQQLDYRRGIDLIRRAAETADENAPQGAYVRSHIYCLQGETTDRVLGLWYATSKGAEADSYT